MAIFLMASLRRCLLSVQVGGTGSCHWSSRCPNGRKCRDSSLHDETFLKENLEMLFLYRQARAAKSPCHEKSY